MCCATNKLDHTPREVDAHRHTSTHAFSGTKLYLGKEPFFWFGGSSSWWWWISDPSNSYASGLAAQLALRESLSWLTKEAGMGLVVVLVFLPLFTDRLWPQRLQTHFLSPGNGFLIVFPQTFHIGLTGNAEQGENYWELFDFVEISAGHHPWLLRQFIDASHWSPDASQNSRQRQACKLVNTLSMGLGVPLTFMSLDSLESWIPHLQNEDDHLCCLPSYGTHEGTRPSLNRKVLLGQGGAMLMRGTGEGQSFSAKFLLGANSWDKWTGSCFVLPYFIVKLRILKS